MNILIGGIVTVVAMTGFGFAAMYGIDKQEGMECYQWEMQAVQFKGNFYITHWQDQQCRARNIFINAPVKD